MTALCGRVKSIFALLALLGLGGCEALAPRIAPVQSARVTQVERFEQYFVAESVPHAERVLLSMLGKKNYDALTAEEWAPYAQKLVDGSITTVGVGTFVVALVPDSYDQFVVSGWGQLSAVDVSTEQVLISGVFHVPNAAPIPVTTLGGAVSLRVHLRLIRRFAVERANYEHESEIVLRLHTRRLDQDLYVIDYGAGHEVGVLGDLGHLEVIGCLEFADRGGGHGVIDLRGRQLLRDDYKESLTRGGFPAAVPGPPVPPWVPLENCTGSARARNCACQRIRSRSRPPSAGAAGGQFGQSGHL